MHWFTVTPYYGICHRNITTGMSVLVITFLCSWNPLQDGEWAASTTFRYSHLKNIQVPFYLDLKMHLNLLIVTTKALDTESQWSIKYLVLSICNNEQCCASVRDQTPQSSVVTSSQCALFTKKIVHTDPLHFNIMMMSSSSHLLAFRVRSCMSSNILAASQTHWVWL